MQEIKTVTASLEGMRVVVGDGICTLLEYDFVKNDWNTMAEMPLPLRREVAELWVAGWNSVDQRDALIAMTDPSEEHPQPPSTKSKILLKVWSPI